MRLSLLAMVLVFGGRVFADVISGVVSGVAPDGFDPSWTWVTIRTEAGSVAAGCDDRTPRDELRALIDAEVSVPCTRQRFELWRGSDRFFYSMRARPRVLRHPPENPFAVENVSETPALHRQRLTGRALLVGKRRLFVAGDRGSVFTVTPQEGERMPEPGDTVTVSGFLGSGTFANQLTEARIRPEPDVPRRELKVTDFRREELGANEILHGMIIRFSGLAEADGDAVRDGLLPVDCGRGVRIMIDVSDLDAAAFDGIRRGCTIEVTGLCLFEYAESSAELPVPMFRGLTIIPPDGASLRILRRAPWWTPGRLLAVIGTLVAALFGVFVWNFLLRRLVERRSREALKAEVASVASELRVEERTRLAVELHDAISQNLAGASMQIDAARTFFAHGDARTDRCLAAASNTLVSCRGELKNCIWDLRSRALEEPTVDAAIRKVLQPHLGDVRLALRFNVPRAKISENTLHALLQIVRELVVNAIRHGRAASVSVAGAFEDGKLLFSVSDDGCGFDAAHRPGIAEGHFGLQGVAERLRRLGGDMEIESRRKGGTRIALWIRSGC